MPSRRSCGECDSRGLLPRRRETSLRPGGVARTPTGPRDRRARESPSTGIVAIPPAAPAFGRGRAAAPPLREWAARPMPDSSSRRSGRIDVHGDDIVAGRKVEGGAARRRNAEDASSGPEGARLDGGIFVHAAEEQLAGSATRVEAARSPGGLGFAGVVLHRGRLAETQTNTRKAKFLTTIPPGSWISLRAQSNSIRVEQDEEDCLDRGAGHGLDSAQRPDRQSGLGDSEALQKDRPDSRTEPRHGFHDAELVRLPSQDLAPEPFVEPDAGDGETDQSGRRKGGGISSRDV